MSAPLPASTPDELLKTLGEALKLDEAGDEDALLRTCSDLEDVDLIRAVFMVHDVLRGLAPPEGRMRDMLRIQTSALVAAFSHFAFEPFAEAFREHLTWCEDGRALIEEWRDEGEDDERDEDARLDNVADVLADLTEQLRRIRERLEQAEANVAAEGDNA